MQADFHSQSPAQHHRSRMKISDTDASVGRARFFPPRIPPQTFDAFRSVRRPFHTHHLTGTTPRCRRHYPCMDSSVVSVAAAAEYETTSHSPGQTNIPKTNAHKSHTFQLRSHFRSQRRGQPTPPVASTLATTHTICRLTSTASHRRSTIAVG